MSPEEHEIMRSVEDHYWWYRALRRHVVESIDGRARAGKILDAGCGTGGMLAAVREALPEANLVGVDAGERALELTRDRALGAELQRASVDDLPFADETFDCVLSIDVWSAATVDPAKAAGESRRVLRRGGQLIVNLAAFDFLRGEHDVAVDVNRRFTRRELTRLLTAGGFAVERMTYWNALLMPPVALARWNSRRRPPENARSDFRPLPNALNDTLREIALLELNFSRYLALPFGTSLFAVARRND